MLRRGETVHTVVYSGSGKKQTAAGGNAEQSDLSDSTVSTETGGRAEADTESNGNDQGGNRKSSSWSRYNDSLVHMHGCRHCYPPSNDIPRTCPVCGREVPSDGYVVARMFERQGRKHVHVLGCTQCRGPGSRQK
jgi:formate-dependent nitrite reductase cytochrome c552 subunit